MQRPRHSLVQRFAHHFRVHALQSRGYALLDNPLEEKKQICQNSVSSNLFFETLMHSLRCLND